MGTLTVTMKKILLVIVAISAVQWGLAGCSSPTRVPVSLEPLNNWLLCHGPATWHYPFSLPPCPYCGVAQASDEAAPAGQQAEGAAPRGSKTGEEKRHAADADANQ